MLDLVKIGQYITKLRNENKMSQQELADTLYVTHQAVSKWENGKALPNIEIMASLTKLFHITIDDLLCQEELLEHDFGALLKSHPRSYCVNQLITGKIPSLVHEVLYLLSQDERDVVLSHIIHHDMACDITLLFPYLNEFERRRVLEAIKKKIVQCNLHELNYMLTPYEKKYLLKE